MLRELADHGVRGEEAVRYISWWNVKSPKSVVLSLAGGSRVVVREDQVAGGGLVEVRGDGRHDVVPFANFGAFRNLSILDGDRRKRGL